MGAKIKSEFHTMQSIINSDPINTSVEDTESMGGGGGWEEHLKESRR